MLRTITTFDIDNLIRMAKKSTRKRTILRLHEHEEPVQRMINAMIPGTYITPHKHEDPDKVELFNILEGSCAVLHFDNRGEVAELVMLSTTGPTKVVDIPPRTYHTIVPLKPCALLEIIQGPYDVETHKSLAPWAPAEDNPKAEDYRLYLESIIHNW